MHKKHFAGRAFNVVEPASVGLPAHTAPTFDDQGNRGFVVEKKTRRVFDVDGKRPTLIRIYDAFHATGSGRDFAIAAMALGHSATIAVKLAARFDVHTSSDVDQLRIGARSRRL